MMLKNAAFKNTGVTPNLAKKHPRKRFFAYQEQEISKTSHNQKL